MPSYTTLTDAELADLLARFGVSSVASSEPLAGGLANSSYLVRCADERLVLTLCDDKDEQEVGRLTLLLAALEEEGFPATRLVRCTSETRPLYTLHRGKAVILKRFVEGAPPVTVIPEAVRQMGAAMAALHQVRYSGPLPRRHAYGLDHYPEAESWPMEDPFIPWLARRARHFEAHLDRALPRGLIHADLWPENTVFEGGELAALIDFEEACFYYLIFDLAMCIVGSCVEGGSFRQDLVDALLGGYQQLRRLSQAERDQLPLYVEYAAATSAFWRFRQFNVRVPDPERKDLYLEMQRLAENVGEGLAPSRITN